MACTATQLSWGQGSTKGYAGRIKQRGRGRETAHRNAVSAAALHEDAAALEQLYEESAPRVLKTLNRITRNREDAEDALQEAFLSAFVHAKDFDGRSSFATWFTRIAINSALMILRKKRTHPEHPIDEGNSTDVGEKHWVIPDRAANPERLYAQQERETILKAAVGDLRPTIRKTVEVGQLQDRSLKETADMLGISVAAAKARLFHARAALRKSRRLKSMNRARFPLAAFTGCASRAEIQGRLTC
jgi:RNA polymerase sigma factor (sigma-70 family)